MAGAGLRGQRQAQVTTWDLARWAGASVGVRAAMGSRIWALSHQGSPGSDDRGVQWPGDGWMLQNGEQGWGVCQPWTL